MTAVLTHPLDLEVLSMAGCPCGGSCACHGGSGAFPTPCSVPGGCGSVRSGCSCGRPTGDGAYLCQRCTATLAEELRLLGPAVTEVPVTERWARDYDEGGRQLRDPSGQLVPVGYGRGTTTRWDIPTGTAGLLEHLELTASRQARIAPGTGGGDTPVPFHRRASEVRGRLDQQLRPWALWLAGQLPPVPAPACVNPRHDDPSVCCIACRHFGAAAAKLTKERRERATRRLTTASVAGVVAFLVEQMPSIRRRPDAGDLADAVHKAVATVQKVIDRPGSQRYGGPCGAELAGALCDIPLYAEEGDAEFECGSCGTRWKVEQRQAWLRRLTADELATAPLIASALSTTDVPLDVKRIHQWATRGQLVAHGHLPAQACNAHRSTHTRPVEGCEACAKKRGQPQYRVGDVEQLLINHAERKTRGAERRAKRGSTR